MRQELCKRGNRSSFIYQIFIICAYYLPGTFLGIGDTGVNRRDYLPSKLTIQGLRIIVLTHMR